MRVAIIEPVGGHGGMNYYDFCLAEGLSSTGAKVTVYTCDKTDVPYNPPFNVKITFNKIWGNTNFLLRAGRFFICLLRTLLDAKQNCIEFVHYHFFHYTILEFLCVSLAKISGFKIVVTAHDVESFAGGNSYISAARILDHADKIIAHNKVSKKELIENIHISPDKIVIVSHGNYLNVIPDYPSPGEARARLNLSPDCIVLLFFGQVKQVKGVDLLLRALPKVIKKFPKLKLLVAGKIWKDDFSKYKKLIQEKNLHEYIDLHIRYIQDNDVAIYYRAADIAVLPYRKIYQSGVLLMAMSYGVPVVVSDLEGMVEIVENGKNGFTFQAGNVNSLSLQIIKALSDTDRLDYISLAGLEAMKEKHDWESIGKQTSILYKDIQR